MSEVLKDTLRLDSTICVIDALNFEKTRDFITIITQLMSSNFIVLTKTEMVEKEKIEKIKGLIKEINPNTKIFTKDKECYDEILDKSVLDPTILDNLEKETIHEKEKFEHVFFKTKEPVDFSKFNDYFSTPNPDLIRVKGFIRFYEDTEYDKKYVFQLVGSNKYLTDKEWQEQEEKQSALILIGKKLDKEKIKNDLNGLIKKK